MDGRVDAPDEVERSRAALGREARAFDDRRVQLGMAGALEVDPVDIAELSIRERLDAQRLRLRAGGRHAPRSPPSLRAATSSSQCRSRTPKVSMRVPHEST